MRLLPLIFIGLLAAMLPAESSAQAAAAKAPAKAQGNDKEAQDIQYNVVRLQGLNKVTGRISRIEGAVGTVLTFGKLEIIAHRCWKSKPDERPEDAALLEIREIRPGEGPQRIFLGWMFASSPGLSGLEHPVYDVGVLSCDYSDDPESAGRESAEQEDAVKKDTDGKGAKTPHKEPDAEDAAKAKAAPSSKNEKKIKVRPAPGAPAGGD